MPTPGIDEEQTKGQDRSPTVRANSRTRLRAAPERLVSRLRHQSSQNSQASLEALQACANNKLLIRQRLRHGRRTLGWRLRVLTQTRTTWPRSVRHDRHNATRPQRGENKPMISAAREHKNTGLNIRPLTLYRGGGSETVPLRHLPGYKEEMAY